MIVRNDAFDLLPISHELRTENFTWISCNVSKMETQILCLFSFYNIFLYLPTIVCNRQKKA